MICSLDATPITGSIYQGSLPPPGVSVRDCGFNILVLAAFEYQPPRRQFPGVLVLKVPLDDAEISQKEWNLASTNAAVVAHHVRHGAKALITCHAGRNRSGLVTALTLYNLGAGSGSSIVNRIKKRRLGALTNSSFVRAISSLR